jgi:hypothetical protein
MRQTCQVMLPEGLCGKPAVDFFDEDEGDDRFYVCAEHWDEINAIDSAEDVEDFDDDDF